MRIQALLCDAASVREGLLHVLGGGITRLWRKDFPARMSVDLALVFTVHPTELGERHRFRVLVQDADGKALATMDAEFQVNAPEEGRGPEPGEELVVPRALPLRDVAVPEPGTYSVEILVDGQHVQSLPFRAVRRE